jgi:hypothetical protein
MILTAWYIPATEEVPPIAAAEVPTKVIGPSVSAVILSPNPALESSL